MHRVITDGRTTILDYGRATRTLSAALFTALVLRDQRCRWPGCDRTPQHCEGHHVWHWESGGPTRLDNLVLLCRRHHHKAHSPGWHVTLADDATLTVTAPNGRVSRTKPPGVLSPPGSDPPLAA
jgi:hypothetical protein